MAVALHTIIPLRNCNKLPLWLALYAVFPCGIIEMPLWLARYANIRPESLAAEHKLQRRHAYVGQLGVPDAIEASGGDL